VHQARRYVEIMERLGTRQPTHELAEAGEKV
jgi:hypothetical protein